MYEMSDLTAVTLVLLQYDVCCTRKPQVPLPNVTVPLPNVTVPLPYVTVPLPNVTVPLPNVTVPLPNVTVPHQFAPFYIALLNTDIHSFSNVPKPKIQNSHMQN